MKLIKPAFTRERLEEEEKQPVFTVRVNKQERIWLEEIKEDLNIAQDSKALKTAAFVGKNVLQSMFGRAFLRYLFKKERSKLSDLKEF